MIRINDVTKTYTSGKTGIHKAVDNVTLEVAHGQITVLKGPSGSGKTTLLSLIGCMARPTTGRIFFGEKEITSLPERFLTDLRRKQVGFVFQDYNLIKGITVLENVTLPTLPLGDPIGPVRRKALDVLAMMEMEGLAAMPVQHLSGGEQQRVAIARALINQPRLIIADEPTAHLDTVLSEQVMALLGRLKEKGQTVLIASHDPLVFNHALVGRVVALHDGRIQSGEESP